MDSIKLLLSRKSHNQLVEPAPTQAQLEIMFKAALRAPDHALLRPWRYRVFSGNGLNQLADYFVQASLSDNPELSQAQIEKVRSKPLRAPMVIVASVEVKKHPKVPRIEQILSAGASVQNLLMAAHFQSIGAIWRTGSLAFNAELMKLLELAESEEIVGFIYLGTEEGDKRAAKEFNIEDFVQYFK